MTGIESSTKHQLLLRPERETAGQTLSIPKQQPRSQRVRCQLSTANGEEICHIFQMPTAEVDVPDLPRALRLHPRQTHAYDTATLACNHTFHPSALFLHFLLTDMRCPACREGPGTRMDVSCLPLAVQKHFKDKVKAVNKRTEQEEIEEAMHDILAYTDVNIEALEDDFTFVMEMYIPSQDMFTSRLLQTPIRPMLQHARGSFVHYVTQYSFQRAFNNILRQHLQNSHVNILFQIQHPILQTPLRTELFNLQQLYQTIRQNEFVASFSMQDTYIENTEVQPESQIMATLVFTPPTTANANLTTASSQSQSNTPSNALSNSHPEHPSNPAPPFISHSTLLVHREGLIALCLTNLQHRIEQSIHESTRQSIQQRSLQRLDNDSQHIEDLENIQIVVQGGERWV
tara:strand:+ start:3016 stop:4218 length:1203 start_codon:yes stop_codon:yes gene_type:complete